MDSIYFTKVFKNNLIKELSFGIPVYKQEILGQRFKPKYLSLSGLEGLVKQRCFGFLFFTYLLEAIKT